MRGFCFGVVQAGGREGRRGGGIERTFSFSFLTSLMRSLGFGSPCMIEGEKEKEDGSPCLRVVGGLSG